MDGQAIHLNLPILFSPPIEGEPSAEEKGAIAKLAAYGDNGSGYARLQSTRPQTIGYSLADSPVGQAAWIYEKLAQWADPNDAPELPHDEILDNIMLYWLSNTGGTPHDVLTAGLPVGNRFPPKSLPRRPA